MPDLTNDPIFSANYRRAITKFSNYGTRRLRFYSIGVELNGYDALAVLNNADNTTESNFGTQGWDGTLTLNPSKHIVEAVLRGVSLIAETNYVSYWNSEEVDPDIYLFTITVAVAYDTVTDAMHPDFTDNGIGFTDAIGNALGNDFNWNFVEVNPVEFYGDTVQYDQMAPPISLAKSQAMSDARKAERLARSENPQIAKLVRRR